MSRCDEQLFTCSNDENIQIQRVRSSESCGIIFTLSHKVRRWLVIVQGYRGVTAVAADYRGSVAMQISWLLNALHHVNRGG